jgi:hypothetical protein
MAREKKGGTLREEGRGEKEERERKGGKGKGARRT